MGGGRERHLDGAAAHPHCCGCLLTTASGNFIFLLLFLSTPLPLPLSLSLSRLRHLGMRKGQMPFLKETTSLLTLESRLQRLLKKSKRTRPFPLALSFFFFVKKVPFLFFPFTPFFFFFHFLLRPHDIGALMMWTLCMRNRTLAKFKKNIKFYVLF